MLKRSVTLMRRLTDPPANSFVYEPPDFYRLYKNSSLRDFLARGSPSATALLRPISGHRRERRLAPFVENCWLSISKRFGIEHATLA